eukprot:SAG11_NODE_354_length_10336_cov_3.789391_12_plen_147_part_00
MSQHRGAGYWNRYPICGARRGASRARTTFCRPARARVGAERPDVPRFGGHSGLLRCACSALIDPINVSAQSTDARPPAARNAAAYTDHWVSNVHDRESFLRIMEETLGFEPKVDFNAGVVRPTSAIVYPLPFSFACFARQARIELR